METYETLGRETENFLENNKALCNSVRGALDIENALAGIPGVAVRPYRASDLEQLIKVYQSAFAEPPWNEYMKCGKCGVEYGKQEVLSAGHSCKKCASDLELVEFWSADEVTQDLNFALAQKDSFVLVAENGDGLIGFTWGYSMPMEKFPFMEGKISAKSSYMDEIAVRGDRREKGVGRLLGNCYLAVTRLQGMGDVALRTDQRNLSSMTLFKRLGFQSIPDPKSPRGRVYDPQYPDRIYLKVSLD